MFRACPLIAIASLVLSCDWSPPAIAQTPRTIGEIIRLDPELDRYVDADATIDVIASGFTWTEGPLWMPDGRLLFSDIPRNTIYQWVPSTMGFDDVPDLRSGVVSVFMRPSGYTGVDYYGLEPGSNGLTLDPQGRLTMCEHGDRRISTLSPGGGKVTLVDRYRGKRFNSPNDLVFDSAGNLYFTDPPYGLPERASDRRRELDMCGVYRLNADGEVSLLSDALDRPNGIGLSADEKTVYVAQSDPERPIWVAMNLEADGTVGEVRELFNAMPFMDEAPGLPDGLDVHSDGTLFASGPGGIYVIKPNGQLLGRFHTGGRTSNCTLGPNEKVLYVTADDKIAAVRLN
ncbi:MAG: SMP-30/gluconolactonase/LRE family protein [Planctomycetota bacterium]